MIPPGQHIAHFSKINITASRACLSWGGCNGGSGEVEDPGEIQAKMMTQRKLRIQANMMTQRKLRIQTDMRIRGKVSIQGIGGVGKIRGSG